MKKRSIKSPIVIFLILAGISALSAILFFNLGGSLAEFSGNTEFGFSFKAGGALAGFLIVFWVSTRVIERLYGIDSLSFEKSENQKELLKFGKSIEGFWWQELRPDNPVALSFVKITPSIKSKTAELEGSAYNKNGNLVTYWKTEKCFIDFTVNKIYYIWERKVESPDFEPYRGYGEIEFKDRIKGYFLDVNLNDIKKTKKYSTEYWRCENNDEKKKMFGKDEDQIRKIIIRKLKETKTSMI